MPVTKASRSRTRRLFLCLDQVKADAELPRPVALAVAYEIGQHFNHKHGGAAWQSSLTIAENIGVGKTTVIRVVRQLRERSYLKVDPGKAGRGHSNQYLMAKPKIKGPPQDLSEPRKGPFETRKGLEVDLNHLEPPKGKRLKRLPRGERRSRSLAVSPGALAVCGAPEGFEELWALWSPARRINTDRHEAEARTAYADLIRREGPIHDEIMDRARQYLDAKIKAEDEQHIYQLANWLSRDNWLKPPPRPPKPQRNAGKVSLSAIALEIAREEAENE
jgi:hypothetical protein